MLIVGLTGGIASGKSAIARALESEPGIAVIDADRIAWETYSPGTDVYEKLVAHFGRKILNPDGTIDRRALGKLIFHDPKERAFLNSVVHPAVMARLVELARAYEAQGIELLIIQAALLLESEDVRREFFDHYVLVTVEPEEQIRRLMARDGLSRKEALRRIEAQTPQEEKLKRADFVIESCGSLEQTIERARALFSRLLQKAEGTS